MMKLTQRPLTDVLAAFRSPDPTPGGGSACALAGAIGASLLAMVGGLPNARTKDDEDVLRVRTSSHRCTELAEQLTALVDRDSEAYALVVGAYRLPKSTDAEKSARSARIQEALRDAIEAPLDVMRASAEALTHGAVIAELGNANASSDVQVGVEMLRAALRGAKLNVDINLGSVKDAGYGEEVRTEVARLAKTSGPS
jgi:formiminotetrahydrofolate cyclodeaminase